MSRTGWIIGGIAGAAALAGGAFLLVQRKAAVAGATAPAPLGLPATGSTGKTAYNPAAATAAAAKAAETLHQVQSTLAKGQATAQTVQVVASTSFTGKIAGQFYWQGQPVSQVEYQRLNAANPPPELPPERRQPAPYVYVGPYGNQVDLSEVVPTMTRYIPGVGGGVVVNGKISTEPVDIIAALQRDYQLPLDVAASMVSYALGHTAPAPAAASVASASPPNPPAPSPSFPVIFAPQAAPQPIIPAAIVAIPKPAAPAVLTGQQVPATMTAAQQKDLLAAMKPTLAAPAPVVTQPAPETRPVIFTPPPAAPTVPTAIVATPTPAAPAAIVATPKTPRKPVATGSGQNYKLV